MFQGHFAWLAACTHNSFPEQSPVRVSFPSRAFSYELRLCPHGPVHSWLCSKKKTEIDSTSEKNIACQHRLAKLVRYFDTVSPCSWWFEIVFPAISPDPEEELNTKNIHISHPCSKPNIFVRWVHNILQSHHLVAVVIVLGCRYAGFGSNLDVDSRRTAHTAGHIFLSERSICTWGSQGKDNCDIPDVTRELCHGVMGSLPLHYLRASVPEWGPLERATLPMIDHSVNFFF